jgi:hypothetical protein
MEDRVQRAYEELAAHGLTRLDQKLPPRCRGYIVKVSSKRKA